MSSFSFSCRFLQIWSNQKIWPWMSWYRYWLHCTQDAQRHFSLPESHKLKAAESHWKPKITITVVFSAVMMYVSSFWFIIDPVTEVSKAVIILYCKIKSLYNKSCSSNNIGVKVGILQSKIACCATYCFPIKSDVYGWILLLCVCMWHLTAVDVTLLYCGLFNLQQCLIF